MVPRDVPRLTATDEDTLLRQVVELAEDWLGWRAVHFRPGRTRHGWRTPVQGTLGKGWPDLILVRPPRIIAVELKAGKRKPTDEQADVLASLHLCGVEVYVWRPSDWDDIVDALR